jgi:hypothetical protein
MSDAEEKRLLAAVKDCRRSSLEASYALMHVAPGVANNNAAYQKPVEADARAREQYLHRTSAGRQTQPAQRPPAYSGCGY